MNTAIVVALLGTFTTLITAILVAWNTRKQSIAIAKLKARLGQENIEVNTVIAWLFAHNTDTIKQYRVSAKEFLSVVQYAKDRLRNIADTYDHWFPEERTQHLVEIQEMVITKYSATRYELDNNTICSYKAHRMKGLVLTVAEMLITPQYYGMEFIQECIMEVSARQLELREEVEKEIQQLCSVIRSKVSNN